MPYTIQLRKEKFSSATKSAGFESDYALSKAMDVNRSNVSRVTGGKQQPGPAFVGGALTALAPLKFEDLFEVIEAEA